MVGFAPAAQRPITPACGADVPPAPLLPSQQAAPPLAFESHLNTRKRAPKGTLFLVRSWWDSNPRALAGNRISSAARYDHFDTTPYC